VTGEPDPGDEAAPTCPGCGAPVMIAPYDIGSGPELSCPHCEWCWGAEGQQLKPIPPATMAAVQRLISEMARVQADPSPRPQPRTDEG
jgi:hypothetical protein